MTHPVSTAGKWQRQVWKLWATLTWAGMSIWHIGPKQNYAESQTWLTHPCRPTGSHEGCRHSKRKIGFHSGGRLRTLGEERVPEASVPPGSAWGRGCQLCPTMVHPLRTPIHRRMDDPDILAGAVEHLLHAASAVWPGAC